MLKNGAVLFLVLIFLAAGALVSTAHAVNLVTNGGFEYGDLTGWTTLGTFIAGYNGVRSNQDGISPYAGDYMLVLGNYTSEGSTGVSQALTTTPGQQYNLSLYWAENYSNTAGNQLFQVLWDNTVLSSISGANVTTWTQLSFPVTGTGSDTIRLQGFSSTGYNYVDNVSVSVSAVPLPAALLLFGPGLAGLAAFTKRFKV